MAGGYGAEAHFRRGSGCPPVVSDAATADLVRRAAAATVGEDHVDIAVPITVGDDVACFLERAPGCYFLVGAGPSRSVVRCPPHHSAYFDIDEAALPVGVETLVRAEPGRARLMDFIRSREDRNDLYSNVDLTPRPTSESETLLSVSMEIEHANNSGYVHGGTIMRLVDTAAGIAAVKHAGAVS